jgi:hypothetical protein
LLRFTGGSTMPNELDFVRYEIHAESDGKRTLVWSEDIPPFETLAGPSGWWQDRLVSIADLAGKQVTFHFTAAHKDGRKTGPRAIGGVDRLAVLNLAAGR